MTQRKGGLLSTPRRSFILGLVLAHQRARSFAAAETEILGVKLRPATVSLLKKIEVACGEPLRASSKKLQSNLAEGGISEHGTPFLAVDVSVEPTEDIIVHELSHIQLAIEGFPKLDLIGHSEWHPWMRSDILDVVQHRIFYPRLRRAGFSPQNERISEARRIIARGKFTDGRLTLLDVACRFFRVAMETEDSQLMSEMAEWYRSRGWHQALQVAEEAYSLVRTRTQWGPKDEVDACIACANVFCRGLRRFTFVRWDAEMYGSVVQQFGVVSIS
jgi:hypothetical protein